MIRAFAIAVLCFGLLGAAFSSVSHLGGVTWRSYLTALLIALLGGLLVRVTSEERVPSVLIINTQVIRSSLTALIYKVRNLSLDATGVFAIHKFIDDHLVYDLNRFAGARETLIYKYGLDEYARVMDAFAAGERAINRAWSASVDGYVDEVRRCLKTARSSFEEALAMVEVLEKR